MLNFSQSECLHDTRCILLNTGGTGGPHGVGSRMSLKHTRTLLNAALSGDFDESALVTQPILNLRMPTRCEGGEAGEARPYGADARGQSS